MASKTSKKLASKLQIALLPGDTDFTGERVPIVDTVSYATFNPGDVARLNGLKFAMDTENTGLLWYKDRPLGIGIYCPGVLEGYMPTTDPEMLRAFNYELLRLSAETVIINQNIKYDFHFLGVDPHGIRAQIWDTLLMAHLMDSRGKRLGAQYGKSLDALEARYLKTKTKLAFSEGLDKTKLANYPPGMIAPYCINDCKVAYELAHVLKQRLEADGQWPIFERDIEYMKELWSIERRGMLLDKPFVHESIAKVEADQVMWEKELYKGLGQEINWRSGMKLSHALYEGMGIERPVNPFLSADGQDHTRFAARGKYNKSLTDSMILLEKVKHPLAQIVLNVRETDKILDYYKDFLMYSGADGAVHTNFNQTGTRTYRLSSNSPNFQNLASDVRSRYTQGTFSGEAFIRTDAYNPRKALLARPGHSLVCVDWKQAEMRMFGVIAREERMLEGLRTGQDIHSFVATMVWKSHKGDPIHKVHREWSKTIGFGLLYAMTIGALMLRLNMTEKEGQAVCDEYLGTFPRIRPRLKEVIEECKANKFIRYASGRVWREDVEVDMYKGSNASIQGPCADLMEIAVLRTSQWLRDKGYGGIVNIVHDEIDFEIPDECISEAAPALSSIMKVSDLLGMQFFTDIKIGKSFGQLDEQE